MNSLSPGNGINIITYVCSLNRTTSDTVFEMFDFIWLLLPREVQTVTGWAVHMAEDRNINKGNNDFLASVRHIPTKHGGNLWDKTEAVVCPGIEPAS